MQSTMQKLLLNDRNIEFDKRNIDLQSKPKSFMLMFIINNIILIIVVEGFSL